MFICLRFLCSTRFAWCVKNSQFWLNNRLSAKKSPAQTILDKNAAGLTKREFVDYTTFKQSTREFSAIFFIQKNRHVQGLPDILHVFIKILMDKLLIHFDFMISRRSSSL